MSRASLIPLLAILLICATFHAQLGHAQRGWNRGGGGSGAGSPGSGMVRSGEFRMDSRTHHPHRDRPLGGFGFIDPTWWYGGYYNEPVVIEREVPIQPAPQQAATPEPQRVPTAPKMVEIPTAGKTAAATRMPAAVFVLAGGERIESRHYLLTASSVQLTVERKRRSIPLEALDLRATLAANRERGLDLQIPAGGSEVVLGF